MMKYIWMWITKDKFELPIAVAGSAAELSRLSGKTINNIWSQASKYESGKQKKTQFVRVKIDQD